MHSQTSFFKKPKPTQFDFEIGSPDFKGEEMMERMKQDLKEQLIDLIIKKCSEVKIDAPETSKILSNLKLHDVALDKLEEAVKWLDKEGLKKDDIQQWVKDFISQNHTAQNRRG